MLAGYVVKAYPARQNKITRAEPFSSQCEAGNVSIMRAEWNIAYLGELDKFPTGAHDDQVDASSGAFACVSKERCDPSEIWRLL